jgi:hypothetical protein
MFLGRHYARCPIFYHIETVLAAQPGGWGIGEIEKALEDRGLLLNRRTLQRRLALLEKQGRIQIVGAGRATRYLPPATPEKPKEAGDGILLSTDAQTLEKLIIRHNLGPLILCKGSGSGGRSRAFPQDCQRRDSRITRGKLCPFPTSSRRILGLATAEDLKALQAIISSQLLFHLSIRWSWGRVTATY